MWRAILVALAMALPGAGLAQWQATGAEGGVAPRAGLCTESRDGRTLCFGLSCPNGGPMQFDLAVVGDDDLVTRDALETTVFVGATALPPLVFERLAEGRFAASLTEAHLPGVERLKAAMQADLRFWADPDSPPEHWPLTLRGSRKAIETVEAGCPLPDFEAQALASRRLTDPAQQVLSDMQAACALLGGSVTVEDGFAREMDIDGLSPTDLRLDHGKLRCSAAEGLVCGPAGCLTTLWLGQAEGGYLRVYRNAVQDMAPEAPGAVAVTYRGSMCGRVGAGPCLRRYLLQGSEMVPES
jgi:hypothetical protein